MKCLAIKIFMHGDFTTPNSKNIIAALRRATIEKPELKNIPSYIIFP